MLLLCKCIYLGELYEWMMVLYHDCTQFVKFKLQGKGTLFSTIERLWCSRISIYENKRYLHVELGWGGASIILSVKLYIKKSFKSLSPVFAVFSVFMVNKI